MTDVLERPVFIMGATYRTGTTFLQRLINSSGEIFVWGENVRITQELHVIVQKLESWSAISALQHHDLREAGSHAWIANLNPNYPHTPLEAARAFFRSYYSAATQTRGIARWGFKEVRGDASDAQFLLRCFPRARILFLVRRPEAVLASMATSAWYEEVGRALGVLAAYRANIESFRSFVHPAIMMLRLEDFRSLPQATLAALADHLGISPSSFDQSLLDVPVRGSLFPASLGDEERLALEDPRIDTLMATLGYKA